MRNLLLIWLCYATTLAAQPLHQTLNIGQEYAVSHATPSPYNPTGQTGVVFEQSFYNKNSMYIKLYFEKFDLAPDDYVEISTANTGASIIYAGQGKIIDKKGSTISDFWSQALLDEKVTVRLHSKSASTNRGFVISQVAYGYPEATIQAITSKSTCGSDDKENVWCYYGLSPYTKSKAVCKLIIGGSTSCTGWLLGSEGHVMTTRQCISSSSQANNTDFLFDYEKRTCSGVSFRSGTVVASYASIIRSSTMLDYTLLDLPNNPSTTYGYLQLRPAPPVAGEQIYLVGHPDGQRKRISFLSDQDAGGVARINSVTSNRVYYYADTRVGSSGSPVLSNTNDKSVVAQHSYEGCPNSAPGTSSQLIRHLGSFLPDNGSANTFTNLNNVYEGFESTSNSLWYEGDDDDFDWTRRSTATPSNNTGPNSAPVGTYYKHIEASGQNNPTKTANLYSPYFRLPNNNTLANISFSYHMWGASMGSLKLQVSTNWGATWVTIWSRGGDQGNAWQQASVSINNYINVDGAQFRFNGTTGTSFTGDMAIDHIRISEAAPNNNCTAIFPQYSNFDNGDLGNWVQQTTDDFDWSFRSGSTPSPNTGPSAPYSGSSYLYTEASGNIGDKEAVIATRCYDLANLSNPYVYFATHMYGSTMGTLSLQISTNGGFNWSTFWTQSGNQGNNWEYHVLSLFSYRNNDNVRFRFVGKTGSSYTSDMAIDAFSIGTGFVITSNTPNDVQNNTTSAAPTSLERAPFLSVSPNPFMDNITLATNLSGTTYYKVANLQGQTVQEGLLQSDQLALPNLVAGFYFLTVYNQTEQVVQKIVRQ